MIVRRSWGRALAVLALSAPMGAALVVASVPSASASSSISAPAANAVYTSGTGTTVSADLDPCASSTTLKVVNPQNDNSWTVTSPQPSGCSNLVGKPTTRRKPSVSPTWTDTMPNGRFTATLTGGVSATEYFYTNLAPTSTPADLTATGTGANRVDLSWTYAGTEPDLAGFRIEENGSTTYVVNAASACSGTSCSWSKTDYDNPTPGTYPYSFTVTALRTSGGCASCGTYTESSRSSSASANLVTPQPPPSPTPAPSTGTSGGTTAGSTGGSTSGGGSGSSTGGTQSGGTTGSAGGTTKGGSHSGGTLSIPTLNPVVAQRRSFALSFNHFSPSLGIPKLPPLPATDFPVTAAAQSENGYQPTLPYKASQKTTTTTVLSAPLAAVGLSSIDPVQFARMLAVALILLVAAGHVRVFLSGGKSD